MTTPKPEAQVLSVDASGRKRVHFSGLLRDAVKFVEDNFPRVHVEPGSNEELKADVFMEHTNDSGETVRAVYHGADSGGENGWHEADAQGNLVTHEETTTEPDPTSDNQQQGV